MVSEVAARMPSPFSVGTDTKSSRTASVVLPVPEKCLSTDSFSLGRETPTRSVPVEMLIPAKIVHSASWRSARGSTSSSLVEPWSPAATVRSTPPMDSNQASPAALAAPMRGDKGREPENVPEIEANNRSRSQPEREPRNGGNIGGAEAGQAGRLATNHGVKKVDSRSTQFRVLLRRLSWQGDGRKAIKVVPKRRITPIDREPSEVSMLEEPYDVSSAFSTRAVQLQGPARTLPTYEEAVARDDEDPDASHKASALPRSQVEEALEEGRAPSSTVGDLEEGLAMSSVATAEASPPDVAVARTRAAAVVDAAVEQSIVLPCGPSDEEKILYLVTGRPLMLAYGFVAFCTITSGMLLFTVTSPYFYWFGAPTAFVVVHALLHYFAVSVWGKDFDPEEHAAIVRNSPANPTVDVFLPVCNEPPVLLANTWNHVAALEYPHVNVYVLDDGAKDEVRDLAAEYGFHYIRRDDRPAMKKAGNLRYAFARTSGDAVVIFDADFCPRADFLRETMPYLGDPSVGIVQTPQFFRRRDEQTWVEQGAGTSQEFFYRMVQVNLDRFNAAVCVGSCGVYRRTAVEPFGGVAPIEHSEDMYTGFKMTELGYKIKYVPLCLAMGICPDEPRSFFMQQYRWCMGSLTLVMAGKDFWGSNISTIHKICFVNGLLYYMTSSLFVVLGPIPIILLIYIMPGGVLWYYTAFAVPSIVFIAIILPVWSKQDSIYRAISSHRIRVIQSFAHIYAVKDRILGTVAPWVPSGGGASKSISNAYTSSVRLMIFWSGGATALIVGGAIWRMTEYPWYHFVPAIFLALSGFSLSMSTLRY